MAASARRSLFSLVERAAVTHGARVAVQSPFQRGTGFETLSYTELHAASCMVSARLASKLGPAAVAKPRAVISDLPNIVENLLLQIACSRLGVAYATVKDAEMLQGFAAAPEAPVEFVHSVAATPDSWLQGEAALPPSTPAAELFEGVTTEGGSTGDVAPFEVAAEHAYFNTNKKPLTFPEMEAMGEEGKDTLGLTAEDRVCVSITLCHAFGIGSGVCSVLSAGSTLVLPAVGGIRGCGVPRERALACLKVLEEEKVTVLFSDRPVVYQLIQLVEEVKSDKYSSLRTGVVKTGSGSDFLEEKLHFNEVPLWTMGKR